MFDQHDKWMHYRLQLHMGLEPFTGVILWLTIWWSNSDPKFVAHQYFKTARRVGSGIELFFQLILCLILWSRLAIVDAK